MIGTMLNGFLSLRLVIVNKMIMERRGRGGEIYEENSGGRHYFFVRYSLPNTNWWPRTTETCSIEEARSWIDEQEKEWKDL